MNNFGRGCLGAIGGLAAAVVLTIVWGIFLIIAVYSFAFALGSTETLRAGGVAFFVSAAAMFVVHLGVTLLVLRVIGSTWFVSLVSSIVGNILAGSLAAASIATLLYTIGSLPQPVVNAAALLLVLSASCPVAISLVIGRAAPWPGVVVILILTGILGLIVLLFRTLYVPAVIVLFAWVVMPAFGGLLGGTVSNSSRLLSRTIKV